MTWVNRVKRGVLLVVVVVLGAIGLTACNPNEYKTSAAQVPQLVDWTLSDPKTFNYALSNESPNVFSLTYIGLITENGLTGEIEPDLAESWKISEDKKRITFTLRDGLKWSDGQPLTADDVIFSYQDIYLNPKIPTDIQDVLRIGKNRLLPSVRKIDDRHIEFITPEPFAPFLRSTGIPILPKHILQETVETKGPDGNPRFLTTWGTNTDPKKIICNGPYQLDGYVSSQRVIFRRNPYYWRQDEKGKPKPYIERIVWSVVENRDTALIQFRSGGLDISEPIRPEDFTLLKQEEKRGKFTLYVGGQRPMTTFMAFNLNQGRRNGRPLVNPIKSRWFNNVSFRQAVAYAIDRNKMNNTIYRGLGTLINSTLIPQSPYYLSPEQGLKVYNYDPAKAKQLLLDAGFKYDSRGQLLDAGGNRVRFTLMTNAGNNIREAMISQIRQDLAKIGMQVDLSPINFNVMLDKLDNSLDWDAYLIGMGSGREPNDGSNIWSLNGSSHNFNQPPLPGKPPIEGRVVADWEAEIARLFIEGAQELDETKRKAIYAKTQQLTQENLPWIPLVVERIMAVVRDRVEGVQYPELGGALWNIQDLFIVD
ncbi:MAG: ABC transporter substrate-binding protein [Kovacikia sp.]